MVRVLRLSFGTRDGDPELSCEKIKIAPRDRVVNHAVTMLRLLSRFVNRDDANRAKELSSGP
jgi:hypothetical protein